MSDNTNTDNEANEESEEKSAVQRVKDDPTLRGYHAKFWPGNSVDDMPVLIEVAADEDRLIRKLMSLVPDNESKKEARDLALKFAALCVEWERKDMLRAIADIHIRQVEQRRRGNLLEETAEVTCAMADKGAFKNDEDGAASPAAHADSFSFDPTRADDRGDPMVA